MTRTTIFILMALIATTMYAQTTQNKTVELANDVKITYSYYLNEDGAEVYHGKMTIIENPLNNNAIKGKKSLICNYQHGKLCGSVTYNCDMSYFNLYYDSSKKVNLTNNTLEYGTKWEKVSEQKENFTVNVYNGYLTGDINLSFGSQYDKTKRLTLVGKAENGILLDETIFELKENGLLVNSYQNRPHDAENAKVVDYIHKAGSQFVYYADGIVLDFGNGEKSITLKYPRYYKTYKPLNQAISETRAELNSDNEQYILNQVKYKSQLNMIDLTPEDSTLLVRMCDSIENSIRLAELYRDSISRELSNISTICKEHRNSTNDIISNKWLTHKNYKISKASSYDHYGMLHEKYVVTPTYLPQDVDSLLLGAYTTKYGQLYNAIKSDLFDNKSINEYTYRTQLTLQGMESKLNEFHSYLQLFSREDVRECMVLAENSAKLQKMIEKAEAIESLCTEQTTTVETAANLSRENTTTKVKNHKNLYKDYLTVSSMLCQKVSSATSEEYLQIVNCFDVVCDKILSSINSNSKDLEKALKSAKTIDEKLNIFLQ